MMKYGVVLFGTVLLLLASGCASNGYSRFYQNKVISGSTNLQPYSGTSRIYATSDLVKDCDKIIRDGYFLIGESSFDGPPQSDDALMFQAKVVGADIVLLKSSYLGSQQTSIPILQYNPGQTSTTTSSGTVNAYAYGSGGYANGTANYYGNSTTTTPGTYSTQNIPITIQRYTYDAGFFRKLPSPVFGASCQPLPSDIRTKLEQNTGLLVVIVVNDSPAFIANILEGDVLLKINREDIISVTDFGSKLVKYAGQKADFEIWRKGETKTISVQLNARPS